ncbi:gamma-butyrobetaine hydroxylase [Colletotrichum plurivorum]|uniref:Gamma-butyrobetaine hydroxylase n=1 Tax=Colletotrichum plurivorum TaxID=2175906 RepID=A0A8H6NQA9_9PEZI|nr:gamma-butyrobetaine hydroxylase [Colletotrichum plurivorum]
MAMRTPFRTSRILGATRTRPSRLPSRQQPFAAVHTTAPRQTATSADATSVTAAETKTPTTKPASMQVEDLIRSVQSFVEESTALSKAITDQAVRSLKPYRITRINDHQLEVKRLDTAWLPKGRRRTFEASYLRDRCPCPQCVSPSSGNKSFSTGEIPPNIAFDQVREMPDGTVHITWTNDIPRAAAAGHVTVFDAQGKNSISSVAVEAPAPYAALKDLRQLVTLKPIYWNNKHMSTRLRRLPFEEFTAGEGPVFRAVVSELHQTGLILLTDVPQSETAVADIALKFGAIKETFYGRLFDVISKPEAENVAYTSAYLGLHSDMLYLESPPRIQLLHCLENTCSGGESIFADAHAVARRLRTFKAAAFRALSRTHIPYHYSRNGHSYRQTRPVIDNHNNSDETFDVWWSPPFQAPMPAPHPGWDALGEWRQWQKAAYAFRKALEHPDNMFEYKLRPGECVLFDNRRVMHGRRAFDAGSGRRWLKGTYVADEDFASTLHRVMDSKKAHRKELRVRREAWEARAGAEVEAEAEAEA